MTHETPATAPARSGQTRSGTSRVRVTLLGIACVAFGLLIWSRLLLVTNYPKTAIAEPQASVQDSTAASPSRAD